ncbi:hypothetical protein [Halomarina rubra]|uniref:ATP phosphoribosyltransferase n=1 Tax=Halomarina rubra TaxID=2071873 RepID=A0ABD6AUQ2_9EURY|nr:hypothetical protein [Halomarina rubra]
MAAISVAVPRKGRPLEAVLDRLATHTGATDLADEVVSTLRYEKAVTKGSQSVEQSVYDRLAEYSTGNAEYTLYRDSRAGFPRRIVFDSMTWDLGDHEVHLVGREEPFRALRKHEFALGFDSADLVLEEVVGLEPDPLRDIADVNDRIDPLDTDVRVVSGLGDTVYHTLLAAPSVADGSLDREFVADYTGPVCISPRYERLVEAVVGTDALDGVTFTYPGEAVEEEAAIADAGLGVYVTVSGSTARDHGLVLGERLFPSETVLLENRHESGPVDDRLKRVLDPVETALPVQ